jgi:hypothetical protein
MSTLYQESSKAEAEPKSEWLLYGSWTQQWMTIAMWDPRWLSVVASNMAE